MPGFFCVPEQGKQAHRSLQFHPGFIIIKILRILREDVREAHGQGI